jgi:hypothetical protein
MAPGAGSHGDKPADVHASWLPRLRDAVDRAERARSRAEESSDRHLQAQRQMRSDVAAMAAAQAELAALCRALCVPGAAAEGMASAGAPAGLTAREPHEPVRRGGRGRPAEAAAGAGAEPRVTEGAAKCASRCLLATPLVSARMRGCSFHVRA